MRSLLEHDVADTPSPWNVLLSMAALNGRRANADARAALLPGGQAENMVLICRWRASLGSEDARCSGACLPSAIPSMFGHCFGAYATPGGKLALLLCYAPSGLRFPSATDPP